MRELPEEAGLAHAGLAHDRHGLSAAGLGQIGGLTQLLQLHVPPHEAREAARGGGMHSRAAGARTQKLVGVNGLSESWNRNGAPGSHFDESLGELKRAPGEENGSGIREVLEAGGEVSGL